MSPPDASFHAVESPEESAVAYPLKVTAAKVEMGSWCEPGDAVYAVLSADGRRQTIKTPHSGFVHLRLAVGQLIEGPTVAFFVNDSRQVSPSAAARADTAPPEDTQGDYLLDALPNGTRLNNGQFTITKYIDAGGFGITYFAEDNLGRRFVLKECFPNSMCARNKMRVSARASKFEGDLRKCVDLFLKEARILARISSPNVVHVSALFTENETAYMALDFINGRTIAWYLANEPDIFDVDFVTGFLRTMLRTLAEIHEAGILHRDIAPDNIMLDTEGEPILIDFGAARAEQAVASRLVSSMAICKDGFSPFEFYDVRSTAAHRPASDLYSLAATVYTMIARSLPPASVTRQSAVMQGDPDPLPPLSGNVSGADPRLLASIDRCLSLGIRDRFQSAADWLAALDGPMETQGETQGKTQGDTPGETPRGPGGEATPPPSGQKTSAAVWMQATLDGRARLASRSRAPVFATDWLIQWGETLARRARDLHHSGSCLGVITLGDILLDPAAPQSIDLTPGFRGPGYYRAIGRAEKARATQGTCAPELLAKGGRTSEASDVYTIAAVLFTGVTGKPYTGDPAAIHALRDEVEADKALRLVLLPALLWALAPDPKSRATLEEFRNALKGKIPADRLKAATEVPPKAQPKATAAPQPDPKPQPKPQPTPGSAETTAPGRPASGPAPLLSDQLAEAAAARRLRPQSRRPVIEEARLVAWGDGLIAIARAMHGAGTTLGVLVAQDIRLPEGGAPELVPGFAATGFYRRPGRGIRHRLALPGCAPELRDGKARTGEASDVYTIAALLFEAVTGAPVPGHRATVEQLPRSYDGEPALYHALVAALSDDPAQRPTLDALQAYLHGRTPTSGAPRPASKPATGPETSRATAAPQPPRAPATRPQIRIDVASILAALAGPALVLIAASVVNVLQFGLALFYRPLNAYSDLLHRHVATDVWVQYDTVLTWQSAGVLAAAAVLSVLLYRLQLRATTPPASRAVLLRLMTLPVLGCALTCGLIATSFMSIFAPAFHPYQALLIVPFALGAAAGFFFARDLVPSYLARYL